MSSKRQAEPGLGETEEFLDRDNQLFINKLNYICKHYDDSFKDVSLTIFSIKKATLSDQKDYEYNGYSFWFNYEGKIVETLDGRSSARANGKTANDSQ